MFEQSGRRRVAADKLKVIRIRLAQPSALNVALYTVCTAVYVSRVAMQICIVPKGVRTVIVYRELNSLEKDLGFSSRTLYAVSNNIGKHYKTVLIPKRDGGLRKLSVPDEILKKIQRRIAEVILSTEPVSKHAMAYRYGSSVQKNAAPHVGAEKVMKLDILHFFDSVYYSTVKEKVFTAERFSEPIRVLLTMLCYYKDALPQGAPTSPAITNIIMRDFDEMAWAWCIERGIRYTRYCDDMTFSGDFDENEVECFVRGELRPYGLVLNRKKTAVITSDKRQTVTGIVVNEKLNVSSDYRRKLRQEIYYCKKFGVSEHLKRVGRRDDVEYLQSLLGKIAFVLQTRRGDSEFAEYKAWVSDELKKARGKDNG